MGVRVANRTGLTVAAVLTVGLWPITGSAAAASAPQAAIASPYQFESLESSATAFSGTATDDTGVSSVRVVITNVDTKVSTSGNAVIDSPGTGSLHWAFTRSLPAGGYIARAQARDVAGNLSPFSAARSFDVAEPSGPAFLTLMFGRSQWALATQACQRMPGTVMLDQVAAELHARGLVGTGGVVIHSTAEDAATCLASTLYPSWQQLAQLRDDYGMKFISAGNDHVFNTGLTPAEQYSNICGSLPAMSAHGHDDAWGTFAYPASKYSLPLQTDVVARCFAYGRVYSPPGRNHDDVVSRSPWLQRANSLPGGACNDPALACYSMYVRGSSGSSRYANLDQLKSLMSVGPGEWSTIYMYKFLTGSRNPTASSGVRWDCTSADWRAHWTTVAETYCWSDYLAALDSIPAGVTVVDPATVARTWNPDVESPTTTLTAEPADGDSGASVSFSFVASEPRAWFRCALDGGPAALCDSGVTLTGLAPGPHTFTVYATDAFGNVEAAPVPYTWLAT